MAGRVGPATWAQIAQFDRRALDGGTAIRTLDLAGLPEDPADRFITATAIMHDAALMTADEKLLGWPHSLTRHDAGK